MPQTITRELLERVDAEFEEARTAEEVRAVFKRFSGDLGWKRLCRLFVMQVGIDELWMVEEERVKRSENRDE